MYLLEVVGAGVGGKTDKDWVHIWRESPEAEKVKQEINEIQQIAAGQFNYDATQEFATSHWYQLKQLYLWINIMFWRNPSYSVSRIFQALLVGLVVGFSFWDLGLSTSDLSLRVLAIFQILNLGTMMLGAAMPQFMAMREQFKRDYARKYYSYGPFTVAIFLVELPYLVLAGSLCILCCYWTSEIVGSSASNAFYFWITYVLFLIFCHSFGMFIAAASPHMVVAMLILPIIITFLFSFAGALVAPDQLPTFWKVTMYPIDPYRYFMEGILSTALHSVTIQCSQKDLLIFNSPPGISCANYTFDFLQGATGYIANPDADALCEYCSYSSGDEFIHYMQWNISHRWRNFGILFAYLAFNFGLTVYFVWVFRKQRR